MKISIVGDRYFKDYVSLERYVLQHIDLKKVEWVVSGGCYGTDQLAEEFSRRHSLNLMVFRPKWKVYGEVAGPYINKDVVSNGDKVFAFWDGKSSGTKSSIDFAMKLGKEIHVFEYVPLKR